MSLSINGMNSANIGSAQCAGCGKPKEVTNTNLLQQNAPMDSVNFKGKKLSDDDKKEIVRSARTTAAGWSMFGHLFSTLYFGLRSDKTVAKKYDLDAEKDRSLIKNIKSQQVIWTLPAMIPFVSLVTGLGSWLYNKNMDPDKIEL